MLPIDFCLPDHLLTCTRVLGFRPCLTRALLRGHGCDRREGHFHDVRFPALAGRAATRAGLSRFHRFSRPFTTSPRTSRHPHRALFWRRGSRSFPARLVKRLALPRSGMSSFGGRWSAAPPRGGSPSGFPKEPSHNGRRSHGLCRPGPTRRRPSPERAPHRVLRRR